ncbi:MAG: hypothetical protein RLZZ217_251 [Planctomycetota bacterium]
MASSGLLTMIMTEFGAYLATFCATSLTIFTLVAIRSSRLMPGLRGMPAVTTIAVGDVGVVLGAGDRAVEALDRRALVEVKGLALGDTFVDVEEDDVAEFLASGPDGAGCTDVAGTDDRDLRSTHGVWSPVEGADHSHAPARRSVSAGSPLQHPVVSLAAAGPRLGLRRERSDAPHSTGVAPPCLARGRRAATRNAPERNRTFDLTLIRGVL